MAFSKNGFTLIELLVVVSIIGLLSVIAVTSTNGARIKAKKVSFQNSALSVQRMATMCCDSENGTLEPSAGNNQPPSGSAICRNKIDYSVLPEEGSYPDYKTIGAVTVTSDCNGSGFSLSIIPGADTAEGWNGAVCNRDGCSFL